RILRRGNRPDVVVHLRLCLLRLGEPALAHRLTLADHVREDPDEGQDDDEDGPARLPPPADVASSEQVSEDGEQEPEEQDPCEEHEHGPHHLAECVCEHHPLPPPAVSLPDWAPAPFSP